MHPNRAFDWQDRDGMLALVADVAFCTICVDGPALVHVPVLALPPDRLRFHVSRSNRAAEALEGARAIVSCLGPEAYISPDWYVAADQVPTWNYVAVEAEGPLRRLDRDELVALLDGLSDDHEARLAPKPPWTRAKLKPGLFEGMLKAIVGYELRIEALRGTRKLGQHKGAAESLSVAAALEPLNPALAGLTRAARAMNRLAIFDCDGTLVDGQHNICLAMEVCFEAAGLEPPARERTRSVVGLSLPEAMRAMLPDEAAEFHDALAERYKQAFREMRARGLPEDPLYPGVGVLLDRLEEEGWLLGIATGKSDRGVQLCLEHHGLAGRFVSVQTADRHPSKPNPSMVLAAMSDVGAEPETTLMIGDTSYDMEMARAAGVTAIGVAWGYHERALLERSGAHHVARHPAEVIDIMKAMA